MPIPTYDQMLHPLLTAAAAGDLTRRNAETVMGEHFRLTADERAQHIPSGGSTYVGNRAGWAMTFLTKGKLISKIATKTYRATEFGVKYLASHPKGFTEKDLQALEGWEEAWRTAPKPAATAATPTPTATPAERIDDAVEILHSDVRGRLMEAILAQSPAFFERLVLDVLIKMGYGGTREEAALHVGQTGDEGIDGRINQDALGLDQILVQAKKYKADQLIGRPAIQAFIGSLAGQGVSKGIFITTSSFAKTAEEFVQRGSQTKIVLIDGSRLLDLMLEHKVGVRVERTVEVLDLDQNYFEDSE